VFSFGWKFFFDLSLWHQVSAGLATLTPDLRRNRIHKLPTGSTNSPPPGLPAILRDFGDVRGRWRAHGPSEMADKVLAELV